MPALLEAPPPTGRLTEAVRPILYVMSALVLAVMLLISTGGSNIWLFMLLLPVPLGLAGVAFLLGRVNDPDSDFGMRLAGMFARKGGSRSGSDTMGGINGLLEHLLGLFKPGRKKQDNVAEDGSLTRDEIRRRLEAGGDADNNEADGSSMLDSILMRLGFAVRLRDMFYRRYQEQRLQIGAVPVSTQKMAISASRNIILGLLAAAGLAVLLYVFTGLAITLAIMAAAGVIYLMQRNKLSEHVERRRKGTDRELLFFVAFADIVDTSQSNIARVFAEIRTERLGLFTAMRNEARLINREFTMFGKSIIEILSHIIKTHPSEMFQDFLRGYVTSQSGGGSKTGNFMKEQIERLSEKTEHIMKKYADTVTMMASAISFGGALVIIFLLVMDAFIAASTIMFIIVVMCMAMPAIIIIMVRMTDSRRPYQMPRYTYTWRPVIAGAAACAGGIVLAATFDFIDWWHVVLAAGPAWAIYNYMQVKGQFLYIRNMERNLADFIQEIARVMVVENDITRAFAKVTRNESYNADFNEMLKKIETRCRTGMNLNEAIDANIRQSKSWLLNIIFFLISYTTRTGAIQPAILSNIATFAKMYGRMLEAISAKTQSALMIAGIGSLLTAVIIYIIPQVSFEQFESILGQAGMAEPDLARHATNELLNDFKHLLIIIMAFWNGVLVSKIKFGTVLHSLFPAVLVIAVGAVFILAGFGVFNM